MRLRDICILCAAVLLGLAVAGLARWPLSRPAPTIAIALEPSAGEKEIAKPESQPMRRIVFVLDATGSMLLNGPLAVNELKTSLSKLSEKLGCVIVRFGDNRIEQFPAKMQRVDAKLKVQIHKWLDEVNGLPAGHVPLQSALIQAIRCDPQLVFVITCGITQSGPNAEDDAALVEFSAKSVVKINVVQFPGEDPCPVLRSIAEASGGLYKFVSLDELGL